MATGSQWCQGEDQAREAKEKGKHSWCLAVNAARERIRREAKQEKEPSWQLKANGNAGRYPKNDTGVQYAYNIVVYPYIEHYDPMCLHPIYYNNNHFV